MAEESGVLKWAKMATFDTPTTTTPFSHSSQEPVCTAEQTSAAEIPPVTPIMGLKSCSERPHLI
ncbi:hypothetical protein NQZ68_015014 [Dissostichus eleginoides]|nr:hypothetical protein NQZ68_015014 [Dissostichus eleginoides]